MEGLAANGGLWLQAWLLTEARVAMEPQRVEAMEADDWRGFRLPTVRRNKGFSVTYGQKKQATGVALMEPRKLLKK